MTLKGNKFYIYLNASHANNSVQKKVISQIKSLNISGQNVTGVFFYFQNLGQPTQLPDNFVCVNKGNTPSGLFQSIKSRRKTIKALEQWLNKNKRERILNIYMRYEGASFSLFKLILSKGNVFGLEYQTKNIDEIRNQSKSNKFGLRPTKFLSWFEYVLIPMINENIFGRLLLGRVRFIVGVTPEITNWHVEKAIGKKPIPYIVGNGVEINEYAIHQIPDFNGQKIKFIMVVGSTEGSDWNGIDLIIAGIEESGLKDKFECHLVGNIEENYFKNNFVVKHGYKSGKELDEIFNKCHLAFGAFALGRKNLKQGSTLKMREYAARGIPCVYGHEDVDYQELAERGLALRMPGDQKPNMKEVWDFAQKILKNEDRANAIRSYAMEKLDFSVKMKQLGDILKTMEKINL